jgi:hypothetical protein
VGINGLSISRPVPVLAGDLVLAANDLDKGAVERGGERDRAELLLHDRLDRNRRPKDDRLGGTREEERLTII